MGVNKVILVGRLGADPEVRYSQAGAAIANLRVATDRTWFDKNKNEKRQETEWHRVVVFGKQAESCGKYLAKGREVYVEGRIKTDKYTDKQGVEKYSTDIVAETVQFLGGKGDGKGGSQDAPDQDPNNGYDIPF